MIIVLEGLSGAGKTTISKILKDKFGFGLVEQFVVSVSELREQTSKNPYWINDERKCLRAQSLLKKHKRVVMDRNYISTLAYNYTVKQDGANNSSYMKTLNWYNENIGHSLIQPDIYIYLKSPVLYSYTRKNRMIGFADPWRNPFCLRRMKQFYDKFFCDFDKEVPRIEVSSRQSIEAVVKEVLGKSTC